MIKLWPGGPRYVDDPAFKITTDSVLLADFALGREFDRCMDLGCGGGVISVLMHDEEPHAVFDSIDIRPEAVEICRQNYAENGIRGEIKCADMRDHRAMGGAGEYDIVVCNPPYFYGGGKPSPDPARAAARGGSLSPAQFCGAASYLLKKGGEFHLVHKPEYLTDIFAAMRLADIEPKRLRLVAHKASSQPSLVLITGRRSGRPGMAALPLLILANDDGTPSEEMKEIYHRS